MDRKIIRKPLSKETKQFVFKAVKKISENNGQNLDKTQIVNMIADIFSISDTQVFKIINTDFENLEPSKRYIRSKSDIFFDHCFKKDLQFKIYSLRANNEHFTVADLLKYAKEELNFQFGRTTLYKILKSMGFKYKRVNGRKVLCDQKHVIQAKIRFLRKFLQLRRSGQNYLFIYLDETWIFQNGSAIKMWIIENDLKTYPKTFKQEGKRFTILHAGCNLGFLDGCDYFLDSMNDDRDYHKTMTGDLFKEWVMKQLLPALPQKNRKCVIVMDNAPYHSVLLAKPPTFSSTKRVMQEWLLQHHILFNESATKKQLWELIQPSVNDSPKKYVIDELLRSNGHEVLRLPPYHCQYNPIELAWAQSKSFYNKHINSKETQSSHPQAREKVRNCWRKSLAQCTPENWTRFVAHCERLIEEDWEKMMGNNASVDDIPPIIVSLTESDSDESDSDKSDEEITLSNGD